MFALKFVRQFKRKEIPISSSSGKIKTDQGLAVPCPQGEEETYETG
jgi:hypothetical protein